MLCVQSPVSFHQEAKPDPMPMPAEPGPERSGPQLHLGHRRAFLPYIGAHPRPAALEASSPPLALLELEAALSSCGAQFASFAADFRRNMEPVPLKPPKLMRGWFAAQSGPIDKH